MSKFADSVCIRCGKTRIYSRHWKDNGEEGKGATILHEESVCPDTECQKIVDAKFTEMREKRALSEDKRKGVILSKKA